ncbi:hypothetical protein KKF84_13365 [Myxococcota bacterium]|nr:hypothetical protein [Myxococcota bacterium]
MRWSLYCLWALMLLAAGCGSKPEKEEAPGRKRGAKYESLDSVKQRLAQSDKKKAPPAGGAMIAIPVAADPDKLSVPPAVAQQPAAPVIPDPSGPAQTVTPGAKVQTHRERINALRNVPLSGPAFVPLKPPEKPLTSLAEAKKRPLAQLAMSMLLGTTASGIFDLKKVNEYLGLLETVYASYKGMALAPRAPRVSLDTIIFMTDPKNTAALKRRGKPQKNKVTWVITGKTGIKALDTLNAQTGVNRVEIMDLGIGTITFSTPVDTVAMTRRYEKIQGLKNVTSNPLMGDGARLFPIRKGGLVHLVFYWGWGDCPAGCINKRYAHFTYDPSTRLITARFKEAKQLTAKGFYLWNAGNRFAASPFGTLKNVLAKTADSRWWMAIHAVEALGLLLRAPRYRPYDDTKAKAVYTAMLSQTKKNRKGALNALVTALSHKDPDVVAAAHRQLKKISSLSYGKDARGIIQWKGWVRLNQ